MSLCALLVCASVHSMAKGHRFKGSKAHHVQHTIRSTVGVKQMLHIRRWQGLTLCSSKPTSSSLSVAAAMTARATSSRRALLVIRFVKATCSQKQRSLCQLV